MKAASLVSLPLLSAVLLMGSCAAPMTEASFVSLGKTVSGGLVHSFASAEEENFYRTVMHPEGSSVPRGCRSRETLCAVTWLKPDGSRVYALWNADGQTVCVPLRSSGNIYGAFESGGKRTRLELRGNRMHAVLSGKILYLHGSSDLSVEIPPK